MLLARLKSGGHKCLIFTQMSRMLDVLEVGVSVLWVPFLRSLHAHTHVFPTASPERLLTTRPPLQAFLNLHAYTYVRLDGATKPEQRQILTQRFNTDPKIFCFILSTRRWGGWNKRGDNCV